MEAKQIDFIERMNEKCSRLKALLNEIENNEAINSDERKERGDELRLKIGEIEKTVEEASEKLEKTISEEKTNR